MSKKRILIIILFFSFLACQRDDICDGLGTPNLKIGFFQIVRGREIQVTRNNISLKGEGMDSIIVNNQNINEIKLPLNIFKEESIFELKFGQNESIRLKILYKPKMEFISKACGFRYIFEDIEVEDLDKKEGIYYERIRAENQTLINEKEIHFKIFFISTN